MSVLNIDSGIVIANIVEAMLPRFSDHKLGLLISLDINFFDHGYGADGNTLEREELNVRRFPHFLFVRPSNYTQVYFFENGEKYSMEPCNVWKQRSDHDSCWHSDGFNDLSRIYFECADKFDGRKISGVPIRPCDINHFHHIDQPKYVRLTVHEQIKDKEHPSEKSWDYNISFKDIDRDELEVISYMDKNYRNEPQKYFSGMLIKGSEDHKCYMTRKENNFKL